VRGRENFASRQDGGAELRRVFEEIHPVPNRPLVESYRAASLDGFKDRPVGFIFPPTLQIGQRDA
jgi:hypothetical protein